MNNYYISVQRKECQINTYLLKREQANEIIKLFGDYNDINAKKYIKQFKHFNNKINILRDEIANLKMEHERYLNEY